MADRQYSLIIEAASNLANMGAGGAPPKAPATGGAAPSPDAKILASLKGESEKGVKAQEKLPGAMGKLAKRLGINVGLSSILKQSQIFTGTIGSMFQILGALVDVILAPFLPIIVPIIRLMGNLIPMIHKGINGIINWYDSNISGALSAAFTNFGQFITNTLFGWLPENMTKAMNDFFEGADFGKWMKNLGLSVIMLLVLRKFGLFKLLAPLGVLLGRIPILGPILKNLMGVFKGLGGKLAAALIPGFGKIMGKNVTATGKAVEKATKKGATGGGGMFSKFKPSNILNQAKNVGAKGLLKGVAKKAIPGLSAAFLAYEGIKGSIDVFKSNMNADQGFWKSLTKAGAVAGTAAVGVGASFVPGMGLVAPIAGSMATSYVRDKMMAPNPGGANGGTTEVVVNVDGTETAKYEVAQGNVREVRNDDNRAVQTEFSV